MTVTKRVRYEVLRRDGYTCRYCHATDQPLTVDHVTPTALGGSDDPSNLVAACKDCNAGKSSSSPEGTLVAEVRDDALRHAEMIRQAYAVLVERMGDREEYIEEFANNYGYGLPDDEWRNSIGRFFDMGVPVEIVTEAAQIATRSTRRFYSDGRFRYVCGIVWNQVHAVNEAVELKAVLEGAFLTNRQIDEIESTGYATGRRIGDRVGYDRAALKYGACDVYSRVLSLVVDQQVELAPDRLKLVN